MSSLAKSKRKKEKANEYHFIDYLSSFIVGRIARLAVQPQLGIWRQWDRRVSFAPRDPRLVV